MKTRSIAKIIYASTFDMGGLPIRQPLPSSELDYLDPFVLLHHGHVIRASFRNLMDEHIARHYYIDGFNGEPKKILIPDHLIDIRY